MSHVYIRIKKTGKKYPAFVIKNYFGKGEHLYNPVWCGGEYKKSEIDILKKK